jgi:hypothetical protein
MRQSNHALAVYPVNGQGVAWCSLPFQTNCRQAAQRAYDKNGSILLQLRSYDTNVILATVWVYGGYPMLESTIRCLMTYTDPMKVSQLAYAESFDSDATEAEPNAAGICPSHLTIVQRLLFDVTPAQV